MADGSPAPPATPGPSFEATATPAPGLATPSLAPWATSPRSLWHRETLGAVPPGDVAAGMWVVGDRFVILGRQELRGSTRPEWYLASSTDGIEWAATPIPFQIEEIGTGTVDDSRLSLTARVVRSSNTSRWELLSTADGHDWTSRGVGVIAGERLPIWSMVRAGETWIGAGLAVPYEDVAVDHPGFVPVDLVWESVDGTHWTRASEQLPPGERGFTHLTRFGAATVVIGATSEGEGRKAEAMVRRDGEDAWMSAEVPLPIDGFIQEVSCRSDGCVAAGSRRGDEDVQAMAWHSPDGLHWSFVDLEAESDFLWSQPGPLLVSDAGFLIVGLRSGGGWVSSDGSHWQNVRLQPPGDSENSDTIQWVVAKGDLILALGTTEHERGFFVWSGSLSATMRGASSST